MRASKTAQDKGSVKEQDDSGVVADAIHAEHIMAMKKRGEIAVFDAGKYFAAGAGNQRLRMEEMEEDMDEDAEDAEVGGDLPLSPLPEFYTTSKVKHYSRKDQWQQGGKAHVYTGATKTSTAGGAIALPAQRRIDTLRMPNGGTSSAGSDHGCNKSSPSSSTIKPQPFSPSARLASFLAKFKLSSSDSKSKASSQYRGATPPISTTTAAAMPASRSSDLPNAAALPANGKSPSPRGRFLRVLSSSSSSHSNPLPKPITHMHHNHSIAASTPVSPAGSDPYSPITQSASTTPTSRKNPRSRPRSHASHQHEATSPASKLNLPTTDWRRDIDNSSSRSLSTHLPFLRRKLKAYLKPEKSPRHHHQHHHHHHESLPPQGMNKQEKMSNHHDLHHVGNGTHCEDRRPRAQNTSTTSVSNNKLQVASHSLSVDGTHDKAIAASMDKLWATGAKVHTSVLRPHRGNSPGRAMAEQLKAKDARRRGEWRRNAEEMEDDIEVAERLLRVVKEHQTSQTYMARSYKGTTLSNHGYANYQANGHGGGEMINGSSSKKSNLVSPSSSLAEANIYHKKQISKEEVACPYDSDSSSDLFEIETLPAFSHVAGLYRPRDLPVFNDSNPLKSPLHLK